jgi:hypothetical protein
MATTLSDRQQAELYDEVVPGARYDADTRPLARHKSMLDYLATAGFTKTYDQFKEEAPDLVRINTVC